MAHHTELSIDDDAGPTAKPPPAVGASAVLFRRKKVVPIVVAKKLAKKPSSAPTPTPVAKTEGAETEPQKSPIRTESTQSEALEQIGVESASPSAAPTQPKPVAFRRVKPKVSLATAMKPAKTVTNRIDPSKDSTPEVTDGSQRHGSLATVEVAPKISVEAEVVAEDSLSRASFASLHMKPNPVTNEAAVSQEQVIAIESHREETVDTVVASHARSEPIKDGSRIVESETATPGDLAPEDLAANNLLLDRKIDLAKVENTSGAIGNVHEIAVPTHPDKENVTHPHTLHTTSGTSNHPGLPCTTLATSDCNRPREETIKKIPVDEKSQSAITAKTTSTSTPTSGSKTIKRTFSLGKLLPPELANKLKNSLVQTSSTKRKPAATPVASRTNTAFEQGSDKEALPIPYNEVTKQTVLPLDGLPVKSSGSSATVPCSHVSSGVPSMVELASKNDFTGSVESSPTPEAPCSLEKKVVAEGTGKDETTAVTSISGTSKQIRKIRYLTPSQKQLFMKCLSKGGAKPSTDSGTLQKSDTEPEVLPRPLSKEDNSIKLPEATCSNKSEELEDSSIKATPATTHPLLQSQATVLTTSANTPSTPPVQQKLRIISQIILPSINFTPTKPSQLSSSGPATGTAGSPEICSSAFAPFPSRSPPSPTANPTVGSSNLIKPGSALPFLVSPDFRLMHIPFSSTPMPQQRQNDVVPMAGGSGSKPIVPHSYPGAASEMYPKILVLHRPGLGKVEAAPISTPQPTVPRIVIDRSYIGETEQPMECTSSIDLDEPMGEHEQSLKGCSETIRDMLRRKALKNLHDRGEQVPEAEKAGSSKEQLQLPVARYGRCYSNSAANKSRSTANTGTPYISVATVDGRKEYVKLEDHITRNTKVTSEPREVKPFIISTVDADGKNSDNEFYGYSDKMIEWENAKVDAKIRYIDRVVEQMIPIPARDGQTTSESDSDDGSIDESVDVGSDTEETIDEPETVTTLNDASSTVASFSLESATLVPQDLRLINTNAQNSAVIDIHNAPIIIPLGGQKTLVIPAPQSEATITHEPNTPVVAETCLPQPLQQQQELQNNNVNIEEAPTTSVPGVDDLNEKCAVSDTEQQEYTAVDAILDFENARKEGNFEEARDSSSSNNASNNTTPEKVPPSSVCTLELETSCTSGVGDGSDKKAPKKSSRKRRDGFVELLLRHVNYDSLIGELVEREKKVYGITNLGTSDESEAEQLQRSPLEKYIRERARTTFSVKKEPDTSPSLPKLDEVSDGTDDDMDVELVSEILKPFVRDPERDLSTVFREQTKTEAPNETPNEGTYTPNNDRSNVLIQRNEQSLTADCLEPEMEDAEVKRSVETMSRNQMMTNTESAQSGEPAVALHKTLDSDTANGLEAMVSEVCESIPIGKQSDSILEDIPQSDEPDSVPVEPIMNAEEGTAPPHFDPIAEDTQPLSVEPSLEVISQPLATDASEATVDKVLENTVPPSESTSDTFSIAGPKQGANCSSRQAQKTSSSSIISPFSVSKETVDEVVSDCSSPGFSNFEDTVIEDLPPTEDVAGSNRKRRRNDSVTKEALIEDEILMPARKLRPRQTPVHQSTPKRGRSGRKHEVSDLSVKESTRSKISEVTTIVEPLEEKANMQSSRESLLEKGKGRKRRSKKRQRRGSGIRSISSSSSSCGSRSRSSSNDRNAKVDHDDFNSSSDNCNGSTSRGSVKNRKKMLRKKRQSKTAGKSGNSLLDVVRSAGLKISASMTPRVTSSDASVTAPTAATSSTTSTSNTSKTLDSDEQFVISEVVPGSGQPLAERVMEIVNVHTTHVLPEATSPGQAVPKKRGRKSTAELRPLKPKEEEKQKVSIAEAANGEATAAAASTGADHRSTYECARCSKTIPAKNWDEHFNLHNGLTYRVGIDNELALNDLSVAAMLLQRFMKRFKRTELTCEQCGDRKKSYMGMASHMGRCGIPQEQLVAAKVRCEHCNRLMLPISMTVHLANHCQVLKTKQRLEDSKEQQSQVGELAPLIVEQTASGRLKRQSVACAEQKIKKIVQETTSTTPKELLISISPGMISPGTRKLWETQIKFKGAAKCMYNKCTFTANTKEELETHHGKCWVGAESNADTFFECAICCQQSPRRERIRKHIQRQHPKELEEAGGSASDSDGFVGQTDGSETTDDSGSGTATDADDSYRAELRLKRAKIAAANFSKRGKGRPTPVSRKAATPLAKTSASVNDSMDIDDSLMGDKDELEVYKDMILDEAYEYKSQKVDFSQTCIKLMRQFHREMYGTRLLFEHLQPHAELRLLSQQAVKEYLPRSTRSMRYRLRQVKTYDERYNDSLSDGWERLQTFRSQLLGGQESVFYCGGPVTAMAWLPMPCEELTDQQPRNQSKTPPDQILAIACKSSYDEYYNGEQLAARPQRKCLIQIWNTGPLLNTLLSKKVPMKTPPQFSFAIACDFGPIFQLAFCPSGCYNDRSEGDSIERLGLLAATGSDGDVYVFSLNRTLVQPTKGSIAPRILNLLPVLRLSLTLTIPRQSPTADYTGHATLKIVWSRARGHAVFAAGFSNGVVAVWNLESRSSLLRGVKGGIPTLLPTHKLLHSCSGAITALDLHYDDNSRYLAVANSDRRLKVYDLGSGQHLPPEVCSLSVRSRCSAARWMTHFPVLMLVFDDIFALDRCSLTVHQPREIGYRLFPALPFAAEATDLAPNDWLGLNAVSTDGGDVLSHRPMPFVYHVHERKVIQMLTSTTTVRLSEGDKEVDLSTYEAYAEHCGILFSDTDRVRDRSDTKSLQVKVLRRAPVDKYSVTRTTQVSFNPNSSSFYYYAIGYQAGFVRIRALHV
ncbi:mucin-17-like isoform X2 [Anopheles albimanus]|nr:mucin-17-like isoform X2 [Anopheles albimanus]